MPSKSSNSGRPRRVLLHSITIVAIVCLGGFTASCVGRKMLFPAPRGSDRSPAEGRTDVELVNLPSETEAWYLKPHRKANHRKGRAPVLVFTHGNGELIDDWLDDFEEPRHWGIGVLLVEYPGYGRSAGAASERSIRQTMKEARDWLSSQPHIDEKRIIPHGRSLGGGAACILASETEVPALILESTFTSVKQVARDRMLPGWLVQDPFDNLSVIRAYPGPILGFHGLDDRVIDYQHAQDLQQAARNYHLVTLPCGHNDCPRDWNAIHSFLRTNQILRNASP